MSRNLDDLDSTVRPKFFELLARLTEAGIPVVVINVLRTSEEQMANLAKGVSWTLHSMHLPQPPEGKSKAMDIAPLSTYMIHGDEKIQWDTKDPVWLKIGAIGVGLGFRWGGTWSHSADPALVAQNKHFDGGHFEIE